jgi:hypothetical protein
VECREGFDYCSAGPETICVPGKKPEYRDDSLFEERFIPGTCDSESLPLSEAMPRRLRMTHPSPGHPPELSHCAGDSFRRGGLSTGKSLTGVSACRRTMTIFRLQMTVHGYRASFRAVVLLGMATAKVVGKTESSAQPRLTRKRPIRIAGVYFYDLEPEPVNAVVDRVWA